MYVLEKSIQDYGFVVVLFVKLNIINNVQKVVFGWWLWRF